MAKKSKSGTNKSQVIREYKAANPAAAPKDIAAALSETVLKITPQFVSTVLSISKKKGGKVGKPGRPAATKAGSEIQHLIQAKKLVDQLGGIEAARSAVSALAQLLG